MISQGLLERLTALGTGATKPWASPRSSARQKAAVFILWLVCVAGRGLSGNGVVMHACALLSHVEEAGSRCVVVGRALLLRKGPESVGGCTNQSSQGRRFATIDLGQWLVGWKMGFKAS